MPTFDQRSLSRGEITERLGARADLTAYATGLSKLKNAIVLSTSGVTNRPGTVFCDETRDPTKESRLFTFSFNTSAANSYAVEFGNNYIEFLQGGGRVVLTSQAITNITKASVAVVTYSGSDTYANGDHVIISGVVGMVEINNRRCIVANVNTGANTFEIQDVAGTNINSSAYTTYSSGGIVEEVYKVTSTYTEAELPDLVIAQSGDTLEITHPSHAPAKLVRSAHTTWTLSDITFGPTGSYPTGGTASAGASGSKTYRYKVTAADEYFKESVSGLESTSKTITNATQASPCVITTSASHGYTDGEEVEISAVVGMTQLNGNRYIIDVLSGTTFALYDHFGTAINSGSYTAYSSAGTVYRSLIVLSSAAAPTSSAPHTISWTGVTGAREYSIYREADGTGVFGLIGVSKYPGFTDPGRTGYPDFMDNPPVYRNPFSSSSNYPAGVTYAQQSKFYWRTNTNTDTIWKSRVADFNNFASEELFDDEAATFALRGRDIQEVKHLVQLDYLIAFTASGEWILRGNEAQIVTPLDPGAKQFSSNGSGSTPPLVIDGNALYVQGRGSQILSLNFDVAADGYQGNKVSIFSEHLLRGYGVDAWAYQKNPNSIIWAVRSDGKMLSITYIKEHQIIGFAQHDTDGTFESVTVVPEGSGATAQDVVYVLVKRSIHGRTCRYIEFLSNRDESDAVDLKLCDASATYDGWNTGAVTMTITTATTYVAGQTLTVTASSGTFVAGDVGNGVFFHAADGSIVRFTIAAYTNSTHVTGTANVDIPTELKNTATTDWAAAVDDVSGLWHLAGETVSVWADGWTVASPNNSVYTTKTVSSGGVLTLSRPYATITVGLPYTTDVKTLDLESVQPESLISRNKLTNLLALYLEDSRGIWAGPKEPDDADALDSLKEMVHQNATTGDTPGDLVTGPKEKAVESKYDISGRIFLRQVDPAPMTILSIAPVPVKVGG